MGSNGRGRRPAAAGQRPAGLQPGGRSGQRHAGRELCQARSGLSGQSQLLHGRVDRLPDQWRHLPADSAVLDHRSHRLRHERARSGGGRLRVCRCRRRLPVPSQELRQRPAGAARRGQRRCRRGQPVRRELRRLGVFSRHLCDLARRRLQRLALSELQDPRHCRQQQQRPRAQRHHGAAIAAAGSLLAVCQRLLRPQRQGHRLRAGLVHREQDHLHGQLHTGLDRLVCHDPVQQQSQRDRPGHRGVWRCRSTSGSVAHRSADVRMVRIIRCPRSSPICSIPAL